MGFFQDNLVPFFSKRELQLITMNQESDDVYSFVFDKADVTWKAGQYGLFNIIHKSIKNGTRPFTVSSAPSENVIRITTRIGKEPSEFKRSLLELTPGTKISMRGPVGPFYLQEDTPTLLIAGGIGITPYRSMLKQLGAGAVRKESVNPIHLLYLDNDKQYLFQDVLEDMASLASFRVAYLSSRDELYLEIEKFSQVHKNNGRYYIAGPKSMAESVTQYLRENQIAKPNIKKDAFFGY